MRTLSRGAALLLFGAALIGCVASNSNTTKTNSRKPANPGKATDGGKLADAGKPAPAISGSDADGKKFQLSDYRGKVVLLDFWAST